MRNLNPDTSLVLSLTLAASHRHHLVLDPTIVCHRNTRSGLHVGLPDDLRSDPDEDKASTSSDDH